MFRDNAYQGNVGKLLGERWGGMGVLVLAAVGLSLQQAGSSKAKLN